LCVIGVIKDVPLSTVEGYQPLGMRYLIDSDIRRQC